MEVAHPIVIVAVHHQRTANLPRQLPGEVARAVAPDHRQHVIEDLAVPVVAGVDAHGQVAEGAVEVPLVEAHVHLAGGVGLGHPGQLGHEPAVGGDEAVEVVPQRAEVALELGLDGLGDVAGGDAGHAVGRHRQRLHDLVEGPVHALQHRPELGRDAGGVTAGVEVAGLGGGSGWVLLAYELDSGALRTVGSGNHTQALSLGVPSLQEFVDIKTASPIDSWTDRYPTRRPGWQSAWCPALSRRILFFS